MSQKHSVTFETKCWEDDWEILLRTKYLDNMIHRNNFRFDKRILYINNVNDYEKVAHYAKLKIEMGILTNSYIVDGYAEESLDFFEISKKELANGYIYSISELVAIYLCQTDFLLHFSSDSIMATNCSWIPSAMEAMFQNSRMKVANPIWNMKYHRAKEESFEENENFFIGYGFSDQCYLVKIQDFRAGIYNEKNPSSEKRYPHYGGDSFEKRVDAWMRNNRFCRLTYKHGSYIHKNFPRSRLKKGILRLSKYYDYFPWETCSRG